MWKTTEGSTGRLIQLCLGYYFFYVITGLAVKYFQGSAQAGFPGMNGLEYLLYSTAGGSVIALFVCLGLRWFHLESQHPIQWGPLRFPSEYLYIVPSGVCTAVVIPTTTLMYSLPISVMVAMVIMRGAIIVVGRLVDAVQIRQGLLKKRVYFEENMAVVFALLAVCTTFFLTPTVTGTVRHWFAGATASPGVMGVPAAGAAAAGGTFAFLKSKAAVWILSIYIVAYAIRIYIMNYFKNTRPPGARLNNKGFFAVEQMSAFWTLVILTLVLAAIPNPQNSVALTFQRAVHEPPRLWPWTVLAGTSFGIVAFFSVFIFMFKGRTATFAGLVNRLTSLVAGTTATLVFHYGFGGKLPTLEEWLSLVFILIAVGFLTVAEKKRTAELLAQREIEPAPAPRAAPVASAAAARAGTQR